MSHMPLTPGASQYFVDLLSNDTDPPAVDNHVRVYPKVVAGVPQMFARVEDGTVHQLTPPSYPSALSGVYWINAKTDHSAVGNGIADDRAAVLAALTAGANAAAAGAGNVIVFFPAGTYNVSRNGGNSYSVDVPGSGYTILGAPGQTWFRHPTGMPNAQVGIFRIDNKQDITIRDCGFDGNWGNAVTEIAYQSHLALFPGSGGSTTITVDSTTDFPASGTFKVFQPGGTQTITYTGKTATTFTGCSGGAGRMLRDQVAGYIDDQSGINHTAQADPKNHALFIRGSRRIKIENCKFRNLYGDGVWLGNSVDDDLWNWSRDVQIVGCDFDLCARNGISFGAGAERVHIARNRFANIFTTVIDSEPQEYFTAARNITIVDNQIGGWWNPEFNSQLLISCVGAVAVGNNQTSSARNWRIERNTLTGGIQIMTAIDVVVRSNRIVIDRSNDVSKLWPPIYVDHTADDITIDDNYIYDNLTKTILDNNSGHVAAIVVAFYGDGSKNLQPAGVRVTRNRIHVRKGVHGIYVNGVGGFSTADSTAVIAPYAGTSTGITETTLTDAGAAWATVPQQWPGWQVITGGVVGLIESNTATTLTIKAGTPVSPFNPAPAQGWRTPLGDHAAKPASGIPYVITSLSGVVDISDNDIDCGADGNTAGGNGIYLFNDRAGSRISCRNNKIKNANQYGIFVQGGSTKPALFLELVDNKFWDDQAAATLSACIRFANNGSLTSIGKVIMRGNTPMNGSTTVLSNITTGTWLLHDGTVQEWAGYGAPTMSAPKGSSFRRIDPPDANNCFYINASGSTTWTAK